MQRRIVIMCFLFGWIYNLPMICYGKTGSFLSKCATDCLYGIYQVEPEEEYGYVNQKGDTIIALGKYSICYTDTFCTFAVVLKTGHGFVGIDRSEKILFEIYPFDNGPDNLSDGLMRIVKDGKIGFADSNGKIIIEPQFEAVMPFNNGLAAYCPDCISKKIGEHSSWIGAEWGFIDRSGRVAIKPQYEKVIQPFARGTAIVVYKGKQITIDIKGNQRK